MVAAMEPLPAPRSDLPLVVVIARDATRRHAIVEMAAYAGLTVVKADPAWGPESDQDTVYVVDSPQAVAGRRVLIFRGDGGRDLLADTLRSYGAVVEFVPCYRRFRPSLDATPLIAAAREGRLDALLLTSSEGVGNLTAMLGEEGVALLRAVPVFASHPRIAARARTAGFRSVVETEAGDRGLMRALEQYFG